MYTERESGISIEVAQGEYSLSLKSFFGMLRRRLLTILLVAVLVTGAAVGFSLLQTPIYQASTEIIVGQEQSSETASLSTDIMGLQEIIQTVVEAVNSRVVAEAVIEDLDLETTPEALLANMSVEQVPETQFIQIYYQDPDPERAREIADAVARVSSEEISEVSPNANAITSTVWETALEPEVPVSPDPTRNAVLGLLLGVMAGLGAALLMEYLDDSWRSPEELEQISGVPTFGVVPEFKEPKTSKAARSGKADKSKIKGGA